MRVMSGWLESIVLFLNYTAVPVQLEIFILQCIGWCVLIVANVLENEHFKLYLLLLLLLLLLLFISGVHKLRSPRHPGV
jgi:Na+/H+ antiporter NhaA